jgi:hypothetical protein
MIKFLLLLSLFCLFLPQKLEAFWIDSGVFEREKQLINIIVADGRLKVEITENIKNITGLNQSLNYLYPLKNTTTNIKFFIDGNGQKIDYLTGNVKNNYLIDQVIKYKYPLFFKLHKKYWQKLLVVNDIEIPARKSVLIKLKYEVNLDFVHDFYFSEIFLNDEIETKNLQIFLSLKHGQKIQHFFTIFSENGDQTRNNEMLSWGLWADDIKLQNNFRFYFSEIAKPVMFYQNEFGKYQGQFLLNELVDKNFDFFDEISLFVDDSGSVYGVEWGKIAKIFREFLAISGLNNKLVKLNFLNFTEDLQNFEFKKLAINNYEFRKKVQNYFDGQTPMGKLNFEKFLNELEKNDEKNSKKLVLLVGDFDEIVDISIFDRFSNLKNKPVLFVLDFTDNINQNLARIAKMSGGGYFKMFSSTYEFLHKNEFFERLKLAGNILKLADEKIFPKQVLVRDLKQEILFVKQDLRVDDLQYSNSEFFIAKIWARFRVADLLKKSLNKQLITDDLLVGISSIVKTFGISGHLFDEFTSAGGFREILENNSKALIFDEIYWLENLSNFELKTHAKFAHQEPFYWNSKTKSWQQYSFDWRYDRKNLRNILVEPFSQTYKNLFLTYPDFFAEIFSLGTQIDVCDKFRCLRTRKNIGDIIEWSDVIFWGDYKDHWANNYLFNLYKKLNRKDGILSFGQKIFWKNQQIDPEKLLTRGEFIHLLIPDVGFLNDENYQGKFKDIKEPVLAKKVDWLVAKGVINGFNDGEFKSREILTRAQIVKILLAYNKWMTQKQAENYKYPENLPFDDVQSWAKPWVTEAFVQGKVMGYGNKKFKPKQAVKLGEAAKLIIELQK